MYAKIFSSMYDGTLAMCGPWEALVTFQQLLILSDPEGYVDMTPDAISRRTTIPIEIIQKGLMVLESPDKDSRTPDEEGRRILRLDSHRSWGWKIVNHDKFRRMRSEDDRREYMKNYQHERRSKLKKTVVNTGKHPLALLAHADADADANSEAEPPQLPSLGKRIAIAAAAAALTAAEWSEPDPSELADALVRELVPIHWYTSSVPMAKAQVERLLATAVNPAAVCASIRKTHAAWRTADKPKSIAKQQFCYWIADGMYLQQPGTVNVVSSQTAARLARIDRMKLEEAEEEARANSPEA